MTDAACNPIWPPFEAFYITSMLAITESVLASAAWMKDILLQLKKGPTIVNQQAALNHLQNIINHSGALSRYFWPSRRTHDARGAYLRKVLQVSDNSPLKSRTVRDHLEHFDEKLDIYLESMAAGYVVPCYFGPTPASTGVSQHYFRAYFVDTGTFEILGNQVVIEPLIVEVMRIHNLLAEYEEHGERFPIGK